ncbi:Glutamate racemase [Serratia odorifera]|uniref:Glutamate racemase n=2 Tax=Serratia odorifera TaxID=618 RepID=A0A3S4HKS7_SEROD|nr:Glutamate racemase [Serratia odorifera]
MQVLPQGTRLVDSGAAIARRAAWLISSQENLRSSQEENVAYCMALNDDTDALLPVLQSYGFNSLKKLAI